MYLFLKPHSFITLKVFLIFALVVSFFIGEVTPAHAAPIQQVQDYMSRIKATFASNHDIRFKVTAAHSASIAIDFTNIISSTGTPATVAFDDVDLKFGSSQSEVNGATCSDTATCRNAILAASAAPLMTWSAAWNAKILTLTAPSGGTPIAANDYVRILIGTNATGGVNQLMNAGPGNSLVGTITLTPDTGNFAVSLITNEQINISAKVAETMTFSFGADTSTIMGPDTCGSGDATVGANSLDFGFLPPSTPRWGCYSFSVATNAAGGFQVTLTQDRDLTSAGGQNINAFKDGITATPLAWVAPAGTLGVDTTYGHMGISSNDGLAENLAYTGNKFVGLLNFPSVREVAKLDTPTTAIAKTTIFKIETSALQEAGTYNNTVTAIATGKF